MRKFKLIFLIIVSTIIVSCKNSKRTNSLIMNIDAVIQNTDSINVYYTNSNKINFSDTQSFWTKVHGNKKNQNIQITFPDSIQPKQIRLDFGRNTKQQDIVLNKITFSYKNKIFSAKGKECTLPLQTKKIIAENIVSFIIDDLNA